MSKYCPECGSECMNDAVFCMKCGSRLEEASGACGMENGAPGPVMSDLGEGKKASPVPAKRKFPVKLIALLGGIAAVIAVVIFVLIGNHENKKAIHLENYITVQQSGLNGYGSVNCEIDIPALESALFKNAGVAPDLFSSTAWELEEQIYALKDKIEIDVPENNGSLVNGDKVSIRLAYSGAKKNKLFKCKIYGGTKEYEVTGLREAEKYDWFSESAVKVSLIGTDGHAKLILEPGQGFQYRAFCFFSPDYTADKTENLSNGDVVTITYSFPEEDYESCLDAALFHGYVFEPQGTMEYPISDLVKYAGVADITESVIASTKKLVDDDFMNRSDIAYYDIFAVSFRAAKTMDYERDYSVWLPQHPDCYNRMYVFVHYAEITDEQTGETKIRSAIYTYDDYCFDENGNVAPAIGWTQGYENVVIADQELDYDISVKDQIDTDPEVWDYIRFE